jgi:hypothetical protein
MNILPCIYKFLCLKSIDVYALDIFWKVKSYSIKKIYSVATLKAKSSVALNIYHALKKFRIRGNITFPGCGWGEYNNVLLDFNKK